MNITDDIRNFQVKTALQPEKIKTSREYRTLAILKYSFPEKFSKLHKAEAPDLQDDEGELGIEVTWGGSPKDEMISGESYKYVHAKTEADRKNCLQKIQKNGGNRSAITTTYPLSTAEGDIVHIQNVFCKKLKKADTYRKAFRHVGLAILIDIPMSFFSDSDWGKWLSDINDDCFDFVAIIHWSGVEIFDFSSGEYSSRIIDWKDMDALKRLGRMAAEGFIKDEDPVWG